MNQFQNMLKKTGPWLLTALLAITFYEVLEHFQSVVEVFRNVISIIMPFLVGIAFAWLLDIPVRKLQEKLIKKRGIAVFVVLICVGLLLWLLVAMVVPQVRDSAADFSYNMSTYIDNLINLLQKLPLSKKLNFDSLESFLSSWESLSQQLFDWLSSYSGDIFEYGKAIGQGVISSIIALAAMLFILLDKNHLLAQVKKFGRAVLPENFYKESIRIWHLSDKMLSDFLMGKFLDSLVIGIITAIVMSIFRMPLVALISVIVGITNVIPVAGPFIGGGIGGVIILLVSPKSLIPFLIMILAIQQLDGNIIGPKILGDTVGLPTIWTLFAIVVGGKLFGIAGMVLGVPVFAVIYTLIKEFVEKQLRKKGAYDMLDDSGAVPADEVPQDAEEEIGITNDEEAESSEEAGEESDLAVADADGQEKELPVSMVEAEAVSTEEKQEDKQETKQEFGKKQRRRKRRQNHSCKDEHAGTDEGGEERQADADEHV